MKLANNILVIAAGILIVILGYIVDKVETALEGSKLGYIVDGVMIAALFFGLMRLLQWAVWVLE